MSYYWIEVRPAGDINNGWWGAASDATGQNLIVCAQAGYIYISNDYGNNWYITYPGSHSNYDWRSVASSADGSVLLVGGGPWVPVYCSTNGGFSWFQTTLPLGVYLWTGLAMSSDGTHMIACANIGRVYISSDSGSTWTETKPVLDSDYVWACVASSADGSVLVAAINHYRIYMSIDGGLSWNEIQPKGNNDGGWTSVALSSNGQIIVASEYNYTYVSSDGGGTWSVSAIGVGNEELIVVNSDCSRILFADNGTRLYLSYDLGSSWSETEPIGNTDQVWKAIASSANDNVLIAGIYNGRLYVSSNFLTTTTTTTTPAPGTNFYANIDDSYSGTGHVGTVLDPFSWDDLLSTYTYLDNIIINIKGIRTLTGYTSVSVQNNIWQGWSPEINGPWRVGIPSGISGDLNFYINDGGLIRDGIIANDYWDSYVHWLYNIHIDGHTSVPGAVKIINVLCITYGKINLYIDGAVFKGCTFLCNDIESNHVSHTFNDCLIKSILNVDNNVFNNCAIGSIGVQPSFSYIANNCQIGWNPPDIPAWNGPRELFDNAILAAEVTTPPKPGIGYPSYTGYEEGLWGSIRTSIGAADFVHPVSVFYVDINNVYVGTGHSGTGLDPFSFNDLIIHSALHTSGNTYYIKGTRTINSNSGVSLYVNDNIWKSWVNPWRIGNTGSGIIYVGQSESITYGLVKDCILYATSSIQWVSKAVNVVFEATSITFRNYSIITACTIYGDLQSNISKEIHFDDCILGSADNLTLSVLRNCACFSATGASLTDCQIGWTQPPAPLWDGNRALFSNLVLAAGVAIPPEPGVGSSSYVGYEKGLWNSIRTGIGAVDFYNSYYANIDDSYTEIGHLGTESDPFSFDDLNTHSSNNQFGNIYSIKGSYTVPGYYVQYTPINIYGNIWQGWDAGVNGPWRLNGVGAIEMNTDGVAEGAIFQCQIDPADPFYNTIGIYYPTRIINCVFLTSIFYCTNTWIPESHSVKEASYDACTFFIPNPDGFRINNGYSDHLRFNDCILGFVFGHNIGNGGTSIFTNCAIQLLDLQYDTYSYIPVFINCQTVWTPPTAPAWDDPKDSYSNTLLAAGVLTPPEPGVGYPVYTKYEKGLWDSERTGIGAVYFNIVPPTTTPSPTTPSPIRIIDSALLPPDPNRNMGLKGTANISHLPRIGIGVKATIVHDFENTGFTHEQGPNLIFS